MVSGMDCGRTLAALIYCRWRLAVACSEAERIRYIRNLVPDKNVPTHGSTVNFGSSNPHEVPRAAD